MAFRPDIYVEWSRSPRIIVVEAPSQDLTIQDLVDTCRTLESALDAIDDVDHLLNASGKEDLGGGSSVGITVQLVNSKVAFEARTTPFSVGTATDNNVAGTLLTDGAATFLNDGITEGDTIINFTDGSVASIIAILDDTHIQHYALDSGVDNQWGIGDSYKVMHNDLCFVGGGNLTAIDDLGAAMPPVSPTFGTQVTIAQSTSATGQVSEISVAKTQFLIESQRPHHRGYGDIYYWDPLHGNDTNDGLLPTTAKATFASTQLLVTDSNSDVVFIVSKNSGGVVVITEKITITKNNLFLRGSGRRTRFKPTGAQVVPTISIQATTVEVSGCLVECSDDANVQNCIEVKGDFTLIHNMWVKLAGKHGIEIFGGEYHEITNCEIEDCIQDGIRVTDGLLPVGPPKDFLINDCEVYDNAGCGIRITAQVAPADSTIHVMLDNNVMHDNGEYGLRLDANVQETMVRTNNFIIHNTLDAVLDGGTNTHDEIGTSRVATAVWDNTTGQQVAANTALIPATV